MSYLLIMNPGSRSGRGQRLWQLWEQGLRKAGADYACVTTAHPGHARELARGATAEVVVAVGGDGTINEVLDGVLQSGRADLRLGVLYSGTSPDFCKFHGLPLAPPQAIAALLGGAVRRVDVARIDYSGPAGERCTAHFGCSCNIGLGAAIARFANRWRRYLGDVPGTGLGLALALARNRHVDLELTLDGEPLRLPAANHLCLAKNPYLASGLKLNLDLRPDDGQLYAVGLHGLSRAGMCRLLPSCYSGNVTAARGLLLRPFRRATVAAAEPQEIEFDGDPRGMLPLSVQILPQALALIGGTYG